MDLNDKPAYIDFKNKAHVMNEANEWTTLEDKCVESLDFGTNLNGTAEIYVIPCKVSKGKKKSLAYIKVTNTKTAKKQKIKFNGGE